MNFLNDYVKNKMPEFCKIIPAIVEIMNCVNAVIKTMKIKGLMVASGSEEGNKKGWSSIIDRTIRSPLSTYW